jgi:hypothetical protein
LGVDEMEVGDLPVDELGSTLISRNQKCLHQEWDLKPEI